jgi:uncharacterized protein YceH (UPF0502 family)
MATTIQCLRCAGNGQLGSRFSDQSFPVCPDCDGSGIDEVATAAAKQQQIATDNLHDRIAELEKTVTELKRELEGIRSLAGKSYSALYSLKYSGELPVID